MVQNVDCIFVLLKTKQTNDVVLNKLQQKQFLTALPQRLLILVGAFLDHSIQRIKPDDRTLVELKKPKQQSRLSQQPQYFVNRQSSKPEPSVTTRQSIVVTQEETVVTRTSHTNGISKPQADYSNMTDREELYARLAAGDLRQSAYNVDNDALTTESVDPISSDDIAQLHAHLQPTDIEKLYARLPADIISDVDNQEPLTEDQQQLHARMIGAELERQGYPVNENEE